MNNHLSISKKIVCLEQWQSAALGVLHLGEETMQKNQEPHKHLPVLFSRLDTGIKSCLQATGSVRLAWPLVNLLLSDFMPTCLRGNGFDCFQSITTL